MGFIFQKYVHKMSRKETSFLPNSNNRTTTVETRQPSSTLLPHCHRFNEVMRSGSQGAIFSTEVGLLRNEVKIRFCYPRKRTNNFLFKPHIFYSPPIRFSKPNISIDYFYCPFAGINDVHSFCFQRDCFFV